MKCRELASLSSIEMNLVVHSKQGNFEGRKEGKG